MLKTAHKILKIQSKFYNKIPQRNIFSFFFKKRNAQENLKINKTPQNIKINTSKTKNGKNYMGYSIENKNKPLNEETEREFVKNLSSMDTAQPSLKDLQKVKEETSQLLPQNEHTHIDTPKASELGAYKDPRLEEFEGTEKFKESLTHLSEFNEDKAIMSEFDQLRYVYYYVNIRNANEEDQLSQKDDLANLIAYTNKELALKFKREHKYSLTQHQV